MTMMASFNFVYGQCWYLDSSATNHVTQDSTNLTNKAEIHR